MRWVLNRYLAALILLVFVVYVLPANTNAGSPFASGKKTADEAAAPNNSDGVDDSSPVPLRYAATMGHTFAEPDTTEFEFPEEEESHLARDITVFLIASAFVGYFIIKVFLEGDTEEQEEEDNDGKPTPL
jgi:hypothetical protein